MGHHAHTIRAVENITHSLVGATLAELALPASASPDQRRLFFTAGIVAATDLAAGRDVPRSDRQRSDRAQRERVCVS